MTKELAIIKSYLEFWEQLPEAAQQQALENNGYIHSNYLEFSNGSLLDCIEFERLDTYDSEFGEPIHVFRPKSLQGIEDNNGWIKIESEDDLPKNKQSINCWVILNGKIQLAVYQSKYFQIKAEFGLYSYNLISHYQLIEEPKLPLY